MRSVQWRAQLHRPVLVCGLLLLTTLASAARANSPAVQIVTVDFESKLVRAKLPYRVLLPRGYENSRAAKTKYPVLYLLHGLAGHYSDWSKKTRISEYAGQHQFVIVTPEGNDGWYTDSATVPTDLYESYLIKELIPDVQKRFRVMNERGGRAIAGLSMGGYGAFKFAVKYPEMFAFAGSLSGAFGAATWTSETLKGSNLVLNSLAPVFGSANSRNRAENDLLRLIDELPAEGVKKLPFLYLDCGAEDIFLPINRTLESKLLEKKIPHEFRILPGGHNWNYWDQQAREILRLASTHVTLRRHVG